MQKDPGKKKKNASGTYEGEKRDRKTISAEETEIYGDEGDEPIRAPRTGKSGKRKDRSFSEKRFGKKTSFFDVISGNIAASMAMEKKKGHVRFLGGIYIPIKFFIIAAIVIAGIILIYVDDNTLELDTNSVLISGLNSDLENFRVLVISDMNSRSFGDGQAALTNKLTGTKYDIVVMLGDMVGPDGDDGPFLELIKELGPSKVYFIAGDMDPAPVLSTPRDIVGTLDQMVLADWVIHAQELGATYVDSPVKISKKTGSVWLYPSTMLNVNASTCLKNSQEQVEQETEGMLYGLEQDYLTLPITSYREKNAQEMYSAIESMAAKDLILCLSHETPSEESLLSSASHLFTNGKYLMMPDVVMAGHYCGGVWKIPAVGAFYVQSNVLPRYGWFPDSEMVEGLYNVDDVKVYVTGGLSTNADLVFPFRLFNKPQMGLITFGSTSSTNMLG